jgi:hypothetical protein
MMRIMAARVLKSAPLMDPLCKARKGMSFTCLEQKTKSVAELLAHTAMTLRPLYTDASEYTEQNVLQEHL